MDRRKFISHALVAGVASVGLTSCASKRSKPLSILSFNERQKWLTPFSCNIEQWFRPMPFLDRFAAAKALGFSAVEMWGPVAKRKAQSPEIIADRARSEGIKVTSISPNAPNMADPNNHDAFLTWIDHAIELTDLFEINNFNLTGHKLIDDLSTQELIANYTQALKLAAPKLEATGKIATIEPYNPFNHKGHFIYGVEPALSICREVNSASVKLNWDFFHMQRTDGNLITHLENGIDQVAYVQLADSPDRNQPGTGEVAYEKVLLKLRELGYQGYIGAEFFPKDKNPLQAASDIAALAKRIQLT